MSRYQAYDDDDVGYLAASSFRVPDRDIYRRTINSFQTVYNYYENLLTSQSSRDRIPLQPHYSSLQKIVSPFASSNSADGICAHFLRRGLIKPNKTQMTTALWSTDARWLVLGTIAGDIALWEGDTLKV
jgi:hypothetical protein